MRVLMVEPDPSTARAMELMLTHAGMEVQKADTGEEAEELAVLFDFDIVISEVILADGDGLEVLRRARKRGCKTLWMIVSGLHDTEHKLRCFGFGGDDYLTKPFHREELIARIHALVRRDRSDSMSFIRTGNMIVNLDAKTVEIRGKEIHLTGREYQVLEILSLRKGQKLTKEIILDHLYGGMDEPALKIIDVFICRIRKKIMVANDGPHYIETVWGEGYTLRDPEEVT